MFNVVQTIALRGLEGRVVDVEVDISSGLSRFEIVGLPGKAIQESKQRVMAAINNSGFKFPHQRITINLTPADLNKKGSGYDLPIAVGILLTSGQLPQLKKGIFWGALSLEGQTLAANGAVVIADAVRELGFKRLFLAEINASEAGIIAGIDLVPIKSLTAMRDPVALETVAQRNPKFSAHANAKSGPGEVPDISEIKGQAQAKRALEIAAAGGHNLLMSGSPGSGKTMLARSMAGILPEMSFSEQIEVTKIYSVSGKIDMEGSVVSQRPFRNPHHTSSHVALIGGGSSPRPGEVSLAHKGVLFLDEFPEFSNYALESLRQPLEDKAVNISRAGVSVQYPADFTLLAAMNPCRCGNLTDQDRECTCSPADINRYQKRISGPITDRIDMKIAVNRVNSTDLFGSGGGERSAMVSQRVGECRKVQLARAPGKSKTAISKSGERILKQSFEVLKLSVRSYNKTLGVARTIADLDKSDEIKKVHVTEALSYRI
ncbi:MAG: YifB family Mg chelatase-like AAA ATPase [Candidatus Dojkabacteria bacterium]